jgi:GNAT superfamily N-acetyltransferase
MSKPIVVIACMLSSSESWEPQTAPTSLALTCRWRSRPQHQMLTERLLAAVVGPVSARTNDPVDPAVGYIRHFATHPSSTRRGVGRAVFDRCLADARAAKVCSFECFSSLGAEAFYRALGFETVEPMNLALGENLTVPCIRMLCRIAQPSTPDVVANPSSSSASRRTASQAGSST